MLSIRGCKGQFLQVRTRRQGLAFAAVGGNSYKCGREDESSRAALPCGYTRRTAGKATFSRVKSAMMAAPGTEP